ncbi:hypothetical protein SCHPADRAFT_934148, partial [Schizopora paradoxa]
MSQIPFGRRLSSSLHGLDSERMDALAMGSRFSRHPLAHSIAALDDIAIRVLEISASLCIAVRRAASDGLREVSKPSRVDEIHLALALRALCETQLIIRRRRSHHEALMLVPASGCACFPIACIFRRPASGVYSSRILRGRIEYPGARIRLSAECAIKFRSSPTPSMTTLGLDGTYRRLASRPMREGSWSVTWCRVVVGVRHSAKALAECLERSKVIINVIHWVIKFIIISMVRVTPTAVIVDGIFRELGSGAIHCE